MWLCRLGTIFGNFDSKIYSIGHRHQIVVVNMLQNFNHRYSSHYKIIKYVGFLSIIYAINLNVASSSKVFNEFDSMFLSNVLII